MMELAEASGDPRVAKKAMRTVENCILISVVYSVCLCMCVCKYGNLEVRTKMLVNKKRVRIRAEHCNPFITS
jgi:hypothetical protein